MVGICPRWAISQLLTKKLTAILIIINDDNNKKNKKRALAIFFQDSLYLFPIIEE